MDSKTNFGTVLQELLTMRHVTPDTSNKASFDRVLSQLLHSREENIVLREAAKHAEKLAYVEAKQAVQEEMHEKMLVRMSEQQEKFDIVLANERKAAQERHDATVREERQAAASEQEKMLEAMRTQQMEQQRQLSELVNSLIEQKRSVPPAVVVPAAAAPLAPAETPTVDKEKKARWGLQYGGRGGLHVPSRNTPDRARMTMPTIVNFPDDDDDSAVVGGSNNIFNDNTTLLPVTAMNQRQQQQQADYDNNPTTPTPTANPSHQHHCDYDNDSELAEVINDNVEIEEHEIQRPEREERQQQQQQHQQPLTLPTPTILTPSPPFSTHQHPKHFNPTTTQILTLPQQDLTADLNNRIISMPQGTQAERA